MARPFLWLGRRLAYIALAVVGAGLALFTYTTIGDTAITPGPHFGMYTYPPGDCQESDEDAEDPINVVFYDDAAAENLEYYFGEYHGWGDNGGETQYFDTWGWCSEMDGQPSSNRGPRDRYHARHQRGLDAIGEVHIDPIWGDYSVAAAHFEDWIIGDGCGLGDHAVPENGFNEGRDNVIINWVIEPDPGHTLWAYGYWDNTLQRVQCNGERAWSDGDVAFIQVWLDSDGDGIDDADEKNIYDTDPENPDTDGDGCTEGQELGPDPALGGQRDPLNPYDFYDVPAPPIDTSYPSPPGPGSTKNQVVFGEDIGALMWYGGCEDDGGPNNNGADYDDDKNENGIEDGLEYDYEGGGPPPGGGPNGLVFGEDLSVMLLQGGDSCEVIED